MIRAYHAFITHGGVPLGALKSYGWVADPLDVASAGLYSFEIVVADVIMVRFKILFENLPTLLTFR